MKVAHRDLIPGAKVRIKTPDEFDFTTAEVDFVKSMYNYCGKICTVAKVDPLYQEWVQLVEDKSHFYFSTDTFIMWEVSLQDLEDSLYSEILK